MQNIMSPVRLRLADLLREREMSQIELSELTGLSQNTISKLTTGYPRQVRLDTIYVICEALDIAPGDIIVLEQEST